MLYLYLTITVVLAVALFVIAATFSPPFELWLAVAVGVAAGIYNAIQEWKRRAKR